jgi:hypothetical protein
MPSVPSDPPDAVPDARDAVIARLQEELKIIDEALKEMDRKLQKLPFEAALETWYRSCPLQPIELPISPSRTPNFTKADDRKCLEYLCLWMDFKTWHGKAYQQLSERIRHHRGTEAVFDN